MIEAVIFDMDGVIIDSEPMWEIAEIEIFKELGIEMTVDMCMEMKGRKIDEVVLHWYNIFKWNKISVNEVVEKIISKMQELISEKGEAMTGLYEILDYFKSKNLKIGLASSSKMELIDNVVDKLKIREYFNVIHSAEYEKAGKPEPDVYLRTAKKIGFKVENIIAIEDSYLGIISAKKAGMRTIAIPAENVYTDEKFLIADFKIKQLNDIFKLDIFKN
ncbi:MAG: hexitol phosphatase HxpB [Bacteroidales bacterium]|nr:hexitol phosphatase HxpB [Bacteroidales bacterium]MBN2755787.1 hexitol phosphatase HxpB [Bacteroidales bacterium]